MSEQLNSERGSLINVHPILEGSRDANPSDPDVIKPISLNIGDVAFVAVKVLDAITRRVGLEIIHGVSFHLVQPNQQPVGKGSFVHYPSNSLARASR
jgi:hypothetical protein